MSRDWLSELPDNLRETLLDLQELHNEIKAELILNPGRRNAAELRELAERVRGIYDEGIADALAVAQEWTDDDEPEGAV